MRHERSVLEWYRDTSRAKRHGRWRFPVLVCFGIFLLLSPVIMLVEGLACIAVAMAGTAVGLPPLVTWVVMVATMLVIAVVLAQLIYFGLREARVEDDTPRCARCDYNLTGNVSGICPECGEPTVGSS